MVPWELSSDQIDVEIISDIRRKNHLGKAKFTSHQGSIRQHTVMIADKSWNVLLNTTY